MSKVYIISSDSIKTICQGALGALSFGAYHQFTTNKMMDLNNEIMKNQHKNDIENLKNQHKQDMEKLLEKMNKLEKRWLW